MALCYLTSADELNGGSSLDCREQHREPRGQILVWSGLARPGLAKPGQAWPGQAWSGLAWPSRARPGLAKPRQTWPNLARFG